MLVDFRDVSQIPPYIDVVVVGAGAVGLALAIHLARGGKRVVVLEAGGRSIESSSQSFFGNAICSGRTLKGLHVGRARALGGTTNLWGGQLVRFDPIIFEERPWISGSGWPISFSELDAAYDRAFDLFGMRRRMTDEAVWARLNVAPPDTGEDIDLFFTRWTPAPNFSHLFRKELASLPNLLILTNAPVTSLWTADGGRTVGVTVASPDRVRHDLAARRVVLAQGTIEISRLLSLPLRDGRSAPWARNPWLGRGFCDHLDADAGRVALLDGDRFHRVFDAAFLDGLKYLPKLKLSERAQKEHSLLGIAAHFVFHAGNSEKLRAFKSFVRDVLNRQFDSAVLKDPRIFLSMPGVAIPAAAHYLRHRRIYNPGDEGILLRLSCEQVAVRESGLRLTDRRDALGMPIAELDWRVDGTELATMAEFAMRVAAFLEREGLARVELDPRLLDRDVAFLESAEDGYHHMGMARMGLKADDGVVDRNLQVFGTDNLFVAGAAVFPSTGFPNPTLTAIALGLR